MFGDQKVGQKKAQIEHAGIVKRFGNRLREARTSRGLSQAALAERAGLTASYLGRLERGLAAPGIDLVDRLAEALGVAAADLLPAADKPADAVAVLREQARRVFNDVLESNDEITISLAVQLLARLSNTASGQ